MPYKDEQVQQYGEFFKSWREDDFSQVIGSLTNALALNSYAFVVLSNTLLLTT
jgi:hypothetical protein